jgi:hypothetical protein
VLVYVIMLVAMVAVLGAVIAPSVASAADETRVEKTYAILADIDSGIVQFGTVIKRVGTVYPGAVHQLSTLVATTDEVSCQNNKMNSNSITAWKTAGPFTTSYATSDGLYTPIGTLNDEIEHASTTAHMFIRIPNVESDLVTRMDALVDGSDGGTAGTILYTTSAANTWDLLYRVGFAPSFTLKSQC